MDTVNNMSDNSFITASISIKVGQVTKTFTSSIAAKSGQESLMMDIVWRNTMKQFHEDTDFIEEEEDV